MRTANRFKIIALVVVASISLGSGINYKDNSKKSSTNYSLLAGNTNTSGNQATNDTQVDASVTNTALTGTATDSEGRPLFVANPNGEIDGHKLIAENNNLEMYLKEDTLSIIIRNKATGAVMYSTVSNPDKTSNADWQGFVQSGVVMEYLVGTNVVVYKASMLTEGTKKTVKVTSNGFTAEVDHTKLGIAYELNVTLTDKGFTAEIPKDKIKETSETNKVSAFYVYPFMGYTKLGERKGYMFIPDGPGALIYLDDNHGKYKQPFSEMVYGNNVGIDDPYVLSLFNGMQPVKDPEKVLAPVFGMVHTDSQMGFLGIIEKGDYSAKIEAYPNGAITPYNWISSKFIYRQFYIQPTSKDSGTMVVRQKNKNDFDIKVRYDFVAGDDANYTGLAKDYRQYILDNGIVKKQNNDFNVRIDFLGAEKENWLLFKRTVAMTTTKNISEIINTLKKDGVENILAIYKGWQKGGIYGGLPNSGFSVDRKLGGKKGLEALMTQMKDLGVKFYLSEDTLRTNPVEDKKASYSVAKKLNKREYEEEVFGKVYKIFNYLTPEKTLATMKDSVSSFKNNKVENLVVSGISNILFAYNAKGKSYDRVHSAGIYENAIEGYDKDFNLMLEQPFSYLWKYTNAIVDMPVESSSYVFNDEDVPFFAIALKGIVPMYSKYTNFQANQREFFLKMVEQGIYPSFYNTYEDPVELLYTNSSDIYSSKFDRYRETIGEYYKELKEVNDKVKDAVIESHVNNDGVTKVGYSNGVTVYVNYNDKSVTVDGITVDAKSYKVDGAK